MVYPSHFGPGEYSLDDPNAVPGVTVARALRDFRRALRGRDTVLVPWLQDFSLGRDYTPRGRPRADPRRPRREGRAASCSGTRAASTRTPRSPVPRRRAGFHRPAHRRGPEACGKCGKMNFPQIARNESSEALAPDPCGPLDSRLRRARSASRSKPHRAAVGGSRKLVGGVDESETGSANFFGPRPSPEARPLDSRRCSSPPTARVQPGVPVLPLGPRPRPLRLDRPARDRHRRRERVPLRHRRGRAHLLLRPPPRRGPAQARAQRRNGRSPEAPPAGRARREGRPPRSRPSSCSRRARPLRPLSALVKRSRAAK